MRCGAQQAHPLAAALAAAASRSGRRHACAATRVPRCQRSYCRVPRCQRSYCRVPRCQRSYCVAAGATSACACAATGAMAARSCRLPSRGEPSPGVDAAVVQAIMPSPVCADIRQTPQLITCTWRTIQRTTCSDSITAVPIVLRHRRKRTECEHTRSLRPRYYKLNRSRTFASPIVQCHISEACSGGAAVDDAQCAVGYTNNRWRPLRHAMFTPLRCRCSAQSAHLRLQPRVAALSTTRAQPSTRLSRNVQAFVAHIMQQADCVEYPEYPRTKCLPVLR